MHEERKWLKKLELKKKKQTKKKSTDKGREFERGVGEKKVVKEFKDRKKNLMYIKR